MVEIKMPEAGFNITEGKVVSWYKQTGETVEAGENIVCVETDKLTVDIPAEVSGTLQEIRCREGDVVPVGGVIGVIAGEHDAEARNSGYEAEEKPPAKGASETKEHGDDSSPGERKISPAAKATAKRLDVDLAQIRSGSGPGGRIVKQDVIGHAGRSKALEPSVPAEGRVEFTGWRKVLVDRVVQCVRTVPQCTVSSEADVTALYNLISSLRKKEEGLRITYLPFILKALVQGIDAVPEMNAHCDGGGYSVKREINVGIVVNVEGKLLIPVVKGVRDMSVFDLAREIGGLVAKAREGALEPKDIEGGTITVTNVGPFGVTYGTALLFQPQTAILCMGAAQEVPSVREGRIEVRRKMGLSVTYDHRVLDGAMGGTFLRELGNSIGDLTMLVTMR